MGLHCFSSIFVTKQYGLKLVLSKCAWDFLSLRATGLGTEEAINGFTWYLSAMLIGSYLIYWTLCRNQKRAILHIYYIPYRLLLRHELHLGRRRAPELLDPDFPCHDIWLLAQSGRNGTGLYGLRNR